MKKTAAMFLIICTLMCMLASCKSKSDEQESQTTTSEASASAQLTQEDILGFAKEDNGDRQFNVLVNNKYAHFDMKSDFIGLENGDIVESEVYNRTLACNEYLGIDIAYSQQDGSYNSNVISMLTPIALAGGEDSYDMIAIGLNTGIMGQTIDIFANVLEMKYINTEHDWWVSEVTEQVSMNDQLYFLTGDFAISTYAYLGCVYANLQVAEDNRLDTDFYDMVKKGEWTLEKFFGLYANVGAGENSYANDKGKATLGWANVSTGVRVMWSSCDVSLFERDEETEAFSLKTSLDDRTISLIDMFRAEYEKPNTYYFGDDELTVADNLFTSDRCLFYSYYLYKAKDFNSEGMESEFAILPLPKYDSDQTDYISTNVSAYNALFFLSSTPNPDLSGKVAEFMGWYGKEYIIPVYYDNYLKLRSSNKEENIEMLDLIRDSLRISPNEIYGVIENVIGRTALTDENVLYLTTEAPFYSNPVSQWQKISGLANRKIQAYIMKYYGQ